MRHAWVAVLVGAVLVPLVTWLPMLAHRVPWLGLPPYQPAQGIDLWALQTFWLVAIAAVALVAGAHDRWLGVMLAVVGLTAFLRGATMDPTHSVLFAFGALLLVAVRAMPGAWGPPLTRVVLIGCAGWQIGYLMMQHMGLDPLWGPLVGGTLIEPLQPLGTLGGVDASSAYVAILAPLLPLWLLPFAAIVVWTGHSVGAIAALIVGLTVKVAWYVPARRLVPVVLLAVLALGGTGIYLHKQTHIGRLAVWSFATQHWMHDDPVLGYGLGGWSQRIPAYQQAEGFMPAREAWREAHNEPLQWLVETGLVGLLLLGLWLYDHRRMFLDPVWGPSLAALASSSLTFFPLHIVASALVSLLLIGLATREDCPCAA